jgi:hypothetical protein
MSESTRSPRFWIPVTVLFAAVTLAVPLTCRSRKRSPDTVPALVEQLRAAQPEWRAEPAPGDPHMRRSVFLAAPGFRKENFPPLRVPAHDARWRGLVFVEARGTHRQLEPSVIESWGDRVLIVGGYTFYGDRSMLRIIRQLFTAS